MSYSDNKIVIMADRWATWIVVIALISDVVAVESFNSDISPEKLLTLTTSAELRSEHPSGKAIVTHFGTTSNPALEEPEEFMMVAGCGVKAVVSSNIIYAGNAELLSENSIIISHDMLEKASRYRNDGCTIIYVVVNNYETGFVVLSDTLRNDAVDMIERLKSINVESILLTGDNSHAASHIAKSVGIINYHSECLPEDKMSAIEQYQNKNEMVCMVGDGIYYTRNDRYLKPNIWCFSAQCGLCCSYMKFCFIIKVEI